MRHLLASILTLTLALAILTGCAGGGGDSPPSAPAIPSVPESTAKFGKFNPALSSGSFVSSEKDTAVTLWSGARAGEVSFRSTTLGLTITGKTGDEVTVSGRIYRISYLPSSSRIELRRGSGSEIAVWEISDPPSGSG